MQLRNFIESCYQAQSDCNTLPAQRLHVTEMSVFFENRRGLPPDSGNYLTATRNLTTAGLNLSPTLFQLPQTLSLRP